TESEEPATKAKWREAQEAVLADPRYEGLKLQPLIDLVPVGRDPSSGLWEFAHLPTGEVPVRNADGHLLVGPESGLVLILVPKGEAWLGAQSSDPMGNNYEADDNHRPLARVAVDAFFLSKFEMTQAQWLRMTGANPSFHQGTEYDPQLPLEQVSWSTAHEELPRAGLRLPTEDEWEYACRAGTETPFSWGEDTSAFPRYANVRDIDLQEMAKRAEPFEPYRDGFVQVSPVGSFLPNAWGVHDVHGNVWEWCEDLLNLPGSESLKLEEAKSRVFRGGSFQRVLEEAHCARRGGEGPSYAYRAIGV